MASKAPPSRPQSPKVSRMTYEVGDFSVKALRAVWRTLLIDRAKAVMWTGLAVTLCFLIFRLAVRIAKLRRLFVDDALIVLAWIILLVTCVLTQISMSARYLFLRVRSGDLKSPPPANFNDQATFYMHYQAGINLLFFACLWAVKFSFLLFFRTLGQRVRSQKILWWAVFTFTALTYVGILATRDYKCFMGSAEDSARLCNNPKHARYQWHILRYSTLADIFTDVAIMLIPFTLLWKVQISLRQKLALGGIFSLTMIIIFFSIIRIMLTTSTGFKQPEATWLFFWGYIEATVAVIVACLASFRTLFTTPNTQASPRYPYRRHDIEAKNTRLNSTSTGSSGSTNPKPAVPLSGSDTTSTCIGSEAGEATKKENVLVVTTSTSSSSREDVLLPEKAQVRNEI